MKSNALQAQTASTIALSRHTSHHSNCCFSNVTRAWVSGCCLFDSLPPYFPSFHTTNTSNFSTRVGTNTLRSRARRPPSRVGCNNIRADYNTYRSSGLIFEFCVYTHVVHSRFFPPLDTLGLAALCEHTHSHSFQLTQAATTHL